MECEAEFRDIFEVRGKSADLPFSRERSAVRAEVKRSDGGLNIWIPGPCSAPGQGD